VPPNRSERNPSGKLIQELKNPTAGEKQGLWLLQR